MSIKFHTIEGKEKDIRKEIIRQDDLIIEGGSGSNLYQLKKFRKFGYTGHYVLMDLMYPDNSLEKPSVFITHHGERLYYFSYGGNCFRADHVRPVIERFNAKNPVFFTNRALPNSLFSEYAFYYENNSTVNKKKLDEDIFSVAEAVDVLTSLPYIAQLHIAPSGYGLIISNEYVNNHEEEIEGFPFVELYDGVFLFDKRGDRIGEDVIGEDVDTIRFRAFVEESVRKGWELYLPKDDYDVL